MKSFAFALIFAVISSAYKVNVIDDVDSWKLEHPKFNLTGPQPKVRLVFLMVGNASFSG